MVRFSIPIQDILGLQYYRYELTSDYYNPTIDSTISISCKVTNAFGNNVNNKTLTLYDNGTSVGSATTEDGIATWTVTLSDWNKHHYTCNGASLDLKATGWKVISDNDDWKVQYNEDMVKVAIHIETLLNYPASWTLQNANILGSVMKDTLKPSMPVTCINYASNNCAVAIREDGGFYKKSLTGSQVANPTYCQLEWHYR